MPYTCLLCAPIGVLKSSPLVGEGMIMNVAMQAKYLPPYSMSVLGCNVTGWEPAQY